MNSPINNIFYRFSWQNGCSSWFSRISKSSVYHRFRIYMISWLLLDYMRRTLKKVRETKMMMMMIIALKKSFGILHVPMNFHQTTRWVTWEEFEMHLVVSRRTSPFLHYFTHTAVIFSLKLICIGDLIKRFTDAPMQLIKSGPWNETQSKFTWLGLMWILNIIISI